MTTEDENLGFFSMKTVEALTSLSSTTIMRMVEREEFPRPVPLTERRLGFPIGEVRAWLKRKTAQEHNVNRTPQYEAA